jgi:DNA-binding FrmR family transcriptional regulator
MADTMKMVIKGTELSERQINAFEKLVILFKNDLQEKGLGDDAHGKTMTEHYLTDCDHIVKYLHATPEQINNVKQQLASPSAEKPVAKKKKLNKSMQEGVEKINAMFSAFAISINDLTLQPQENGTIHVIISSAQQFSKNFSAEETKSLQEIQELIYSN